ncbi:thiamine-triphosphatase [Carcharodon carcharias]|uniref:thiamine-triphosphatase n=1 Tax=Carcharodon carcharias TaxID=13397 RepID=UPI001B7E197E|nr:thiamine-triphosphatase [Carcharodon carcharias]
MPIEVERKFQVREDTVQRLRGLGALCLGTSHLEDRYFDTEDLRLTLSDCWLRRRDGCWQLKSPAGAGTGPLTQYRETESEAEILALLGRVLGPGAGGHGGPGELLGTAGTLGAPLLLEFAVLVTERTAYRLEGGLRVDLDRADFGHRLGEIEALVGGEGEIPGALDRIRELAAKLGLEDGEQQPGKMHVYLQRYRPHHFQKLLDAGVLRPEGVKQ